MLWHKIEEQVLLLQTSVNQSFINSENPRCHFRNSYVMDECQLRTYDMPDNCFQTIDVNMK